MLSYPDSKELKELGYSQELEPGDWYYWDAHLIPRVVHLYSEYLVTIENYVKVPTTDGMIEGLGERFDTLRAGLSSFAAQGNLPPERVSKPKDPNIEINPFVAGRGGTPEQALCELWKKVKKPPSTE